MLSFLQGGSQGLRTDVCNISQCSTTLPSCWWRNQASANHSFCGARIGAKLLRVVGKYLTTENLVFVTKPVEIERAALCQGSGRGLGERGTIGVSLPFSHPRSIDCSRWLLSSCGNLHFVPFGKRGRVAISGQKEIKKQNMRTHLVAMCG